MGRIARNMGVGAGRTSNWPSTASSGMKSDRGQDHRTETASSRDPREAPNLRHASGGGAARWACSGRAHVLFEQRLDRARDERRDLRFPFHGFSTTMYPQVRVRLFRASGVREQAMNEADGNTEADARELDHAAASHVTMARPARAPRLVHRRQRAIGGPQR
jgi:hypothetical protein